MRLAYYLFGFLVAAVASVDRFAALFARFTLAALLAFAQELPLCFRSPLALYAVNTIDVGLKKEVLLNTFLEAFTAELLPLSAFATDFSDAIVADGDDVSVGYVPLSSTASDFKGTYTPKGSDFQRKKVTINRHKFVSWSLSDTDIFSGSIVSLQTQARQKAHDLAREVIGDILSCVTLANFGAPIFTGAQGGFDLDDVADLRTAVRKAHWPTAGRAIVLVPDYYGQVVKTNTFQSAADAGNTQVRETAVLPKLYTFQPYETETLPDNGENLVGFVNLPSAVAVAMRYLKPRRPECYIEARAVKDTRTGITVGFRHDYDTKAGVESHIYECNYGYDVLESAALKRLVSA